MLARRLIPCLDVKDGRVVKGINFLELRDAGDPVEQAAAYESQGADELCYLDISASPEGRSTILDIVRRTADQVFMPLTVGGGVRSIEDAENLLLAGADKAQVPRIIESFADREVHVVYTLRSVAAMLRSDWQEQVKHRHTADWPEYLRQVFDEPDRSHFGQWFWGHHDAATVRDPRGRARRLLGRAELVTCRPHRPPREPETDATPDGKRSSAEEPAISIGHQAGRVGHQ